MAFDAELATRVRDFFKQRQVVVEEKRMMGGLCFMVNGKMCVGVDKSRLMARIDPAGYEAALRRTGCVPMDFTGRPMRGFVFVNMAALATDAELHEWLTLALEFNPIATSSKRRATPPPIPQARPRAARLADKHSRQPRVKPRL